MQEKSISGKAINKTITSEDILGKEVVDADGGFIGVAEKVLIDPESMNFVGISVDKGLIKSGLAIGKDYIDKITDYAILLKIKVAYDVKGMFVFDKDGKKVGRVSSVELYGNKNKIKNLYVKFSYFLFLKREVVIPADFIKDVGDNIMLNVGIKDLSMDKV